MAKKCKGIKNNGEPCEFRAKSDGYCMMHHPDRGNNLKKVERSSFKKKVITLLGGATFFGGLAVLASINGTWGLFERITKLFEKKTRNSM